MNLIDIMFERRSVRKYKDENISDDKLVKIIESALLAPTSRNRNPCEFYVVKNKEILYQLSHCKNTGSQFLKNANIGICVIADVNKADTWIEDSSIALTYIHLMATALNIGSCWIQVHLREDSEGHDAEENVREILKLPNNYRIVGIMALGISKEKRNKKTKDDLDFSKITIIE